MDGAGDPRPKYTAGNSSKTTPRPRRSISVPMAAMIPSPAPLRSRCGVSVVSGPPSCGRGKRAGWPHLARRASRWEILHEVPVPIGSARA